MAFWNLGSECFSNIIVYQIGLKYEYRNDCNYSDINLLILSHQLSHFGIPSFYLESYPHYSNMKVDGSVIVAFDIFSKMDEFNKEIKSLNDSLIIHHWTWNVESYFSFAISEHLTRAIVLYEYYQNMDMEPLYFTSFLLFPARKTVLQPFIFQPVALKKNGKIYFRNIFQDGLKCAIIKRPNIDDYVLVPPFEHPFKVIGCLDKFLTVISIDKKSFTFQLPRKIVLLTKPNLIIPRLFKFERAKETIKFENLEIFDYTEDDINNFLENNTEIEDNVVSYLDTPGLKLNQILSDQVSNINTREMIMKGIGDDFQFPSKRIFCPAIVANFLSYFRFDFGFVPSHTRKPFRTSLKDTPINFEELGIPDVVINKDGNLAKVKADKIITDWLPNKYLPISGEKKCHFVVFSYSTVPRPNVIAFINQIAHIYNLFGFGTLKPYQPDSYYSIPKHLIESQITRFYNKYSLSQFQQDPLLTFIVGSRVHEKDFFPHSIITHINPDSIYSATEEEIKLLAFVVYSRIRLFSPTPTSTGIFQNYAIPIIFGFRYEPPFLLSKKDSNNNNISFHFAWDPSSYKCAIIDDIGSILHVFDVNDINLFPRIIDDFRELVEQNISQITFSVLGEGLTKSFLKKFKKTFKSYNHKILLFSITPSPAVQVTFENDFDSDVIIFDEYEEIVVNSFHSKEIIEEDVKFENPLSTCFVASKVQLPYQVSIYSGGNKNDLYDFVELMSHLSWLSVKPCDEKRTNSFPPHICALLRKNGCDSIVISRFEFLPSPEPI